MDRKGSNGGGGIAVEVQGQEPLQRRYKATLRAHGMSPSKAKSSGGRGRTAGSSGDGSSGGRGRGSGKAGGGGGGGGGGGSSTGSGGGGGGGVPTTPVVSAAAAAGLQWPVTVVLALQTAMHPALPPAGTLTLTATRCTPRVATVRASLASQLAGSPDARTLAAAVRQLADAADAGSGGIWAAAPPQPATSPLTLSSLDAVLLTVRSQADVVVARAVLLSEAAAVAAGAAAAGGGGHSAPLSLPLLHDGGATVSVLGIGVRPTAAAPSEPSPPPSAAPSLPAPLVPRPPAGRRPGSSAPAAVPAGPVCSTPAAATPTVLASIHVARHHHTVYCDRKRAVCTAEGAVREGNTLTVEAVLPPGATITAITWHASVEVGEAYGWLGTAAGAAGAGDEVAFTAVHGGRTWRFPPTRAPVELPPLPAPYARAGGGESTNPAAAAAPPAPEDASPLFTPAAAARFLADEAAATTANPAALALTLPLVGHVVAARVTVTPGDGGDALIATAIAGPVEAAPPTSRLLRIAGEPVVGAVLTAVPLYYGGFPAPATFTWIRVAPDGLRTEVPAVTAMPAGACAPLTLTAADVGATFKVCIEPVRGDGVRGAPITSLPTPEIR